MNIYSWSSLIYQEINMYLGLTQKAGICQKIPGIRYYYVFQPDPGHKVTRIHSFQEAILTFRSSRPFTLRWKGWAVQAASVDISTKTCTPIRQLLWILKLMSMCIPVRRFLWILEPNSVSQSLRTLNLNCVSHSDSHWRLKINCVSRSDCCCTVQ